MVDHLRFTQDSSGGAGASPRLAATPCGYFTFTKPTGRVTGNRGAIVVSGGALHGFSACAPIVIPASGVVVFARDEQYRNLLTGSCRAAFFTDTKPILHRRINCMAKKSTWTQRWNNS